MDQFDLFNAQDNSTVIHDVDDVPVLAPEPVTTVAAPITHTVWSFAVQEQRRIWDGTEQHRRRSLSQLERFVSFGDYDIKPITDYLPKDIHRFTDELECEGLKKTSINRYLATVSAVFKHAVDEEVIDHAPKLKFKKEAKVQPRFFTDKEIDDALSFFNGRGDWWMADMFLVGVKTGMRRGEIIGLGDGRAVLTPDEKWVFLPGALTKTSEDRYVPVGTDELRGAIKRLIKDLAAVYSHRTFYRRWGLLKREIARLDDRFVFHTTRHTAATRMANDLRVPTSIIQKMLGHATIQTTQKYVHAKDDAMLEIAGRM
jgi:integrase